VRAVKRRNVRLLLNPCGVEERVDKDEETRGSAALPSASSLPCFALACRQLTADTTFGRAAMVGNPGVAAVGNTGVAGDDGVGAGVLAFTPPPAPIGIRRICAWICDSSRS